MALTPYGGCKLLIADNFQVTFSSQFCTENIYPSQYVPQKLNFNRDSLRGALIIYSNDLGYLLSHQAIGCCLAWMTWYISLTEDVEERKEEDAVYFADYLLTFGQVPVASRKCGSLQFMTAIKNVCLRLFAK